MPVTLEKHEETVYSLREVQEILLKKYRKKIPLTWIRYHYSVNNWLEKTSNCFSKSGNMKRVKESELDEFCKEMISKYAVRLSI
jgi:hypothetical protein